MKIDQRFSKATTFELDQQLTVNETVAVVKGLKNSEMYSFFVLAANDHGTSLPSSVLTINVTTEGNFFSYQIRFANTSYIN
jgi:hypothetical protein